MDELIAGVASIAEREASLLDTIESIKGQVDRIHVFLNGYFRRPYFLDDPKIKVYRSEEIKNMGDAGKFYHIPEKCYYFSLDDDIMYPPDYIQDLKAKIDSYQRSKVISYHGVYFPNQRVMSYYRGNRRPYSCLHSLTKDTPVHVGGTGVMGFHTDTLQVRYEDFHSANMADIWIYKLSQEQKVGIICASHKEGWLKLNPRVDEKKTIWAEYNRNDAPQTEIINSFPLRQCF